MLLCVVGVLAEAFVFNSGAILKGARSGTQKNMFNPFSPKKANTGSDEQGGGGGLGDIVKMMQEAEKMKTVMESESIVAQDPSGGITVTFDGMGGPKNVVISDRVMGLGANALSQAMTETLLEAHKKSTANMNAKMMGMMGGGGGMNMDM